MRETYSSGLACMAAIGLALAALASSARPAAAQRVAVTGTLEVTYICGAPGARRGADIQAQLVDAQGRRAEIVPVPRCALPPEGLPGLAGRQVLVRGAWLRPSPTGRLRLAASSVVALREQEPSGSIRPLLAGPLPYVVILCRFADKPDVTPLPAAWFEEMMSENYPGLSHYWSEQSHGRINLAGSQIVGWYNLPRSQADYGVGDDFLEDRLLADAVRVADPDVFFPNFAGIMVVMNDGSTVPWSGRGSLGPGHSMPMDGQSKRYRRSWIASPSQATMAHEVGHNLEYEHSYGPTGVEYDSPWDVMGRGNRWDRDLDPPTVVGCGTVLRNKSLSGWLGERERRVERGTFATFRLERLEQPLSATDALGATLPLAPLIVYTVEARRKVGYDVAIPSDGVILNRVSDWRQSNLVRAEAWTPGETYTNLTDRVQVIVLEESGTGYLVTVTNGATLAPAYLTAAVVSTTRIDLAWQDQSDDESGFQVERSTDNGASFQVIQTLAAGATSYVDTTAAADRRYLFRVKATSATGGSAYSNVARASTSDIVRVTTPNGGESWEAGSSKTIQWTSARLSGSVRIDFSSDGGESWSELTASTANDGSESWRVPNRVTTQARVRIVSVADPWVEDASDGSFSIILPPPPHLRATAVDDSQIDLTWTDTVDGEDYFLLEVSRDGGATFYRLADVPPGTTAFSHTWLEPATTYHYLVIARHPAGFSLYSNTVSATTLSAPRPPPTLASCTISPSSVPGGTPAAGTVTLTGPAPPGGTSVTLTSSSTAATVPASVLVAAGEAAATFMVTTRPVRKTTPARLTARLGSVTKRARLKVRKR